MTSPRNGSPTRALVLGGGGAVGVGWQTGLLTGLREAGVDLAGAESIVGTSAGALVGALLAVRSPMRSPAWQHSGRVSTPKVWRQAMMPS
jgi:predicted acylesterase/phospholipase RssA